MSIGLCSAISAIDKPQTASKWASAASQAAAQIHAHARFLLALACKNEMAAGWVTSAAPLGVFSPRLLLVSALAAMLLVSMPVRRSFMANSSLGKAIPTKPTLHLEDEDIRRLLQRRELNLRIGAVWAAHCGGSLAYRGAAALDQRPWLALAGREARL